MTERRAGMTTAREIKAHLDAWERRNRERWEIARWCQFLDLLGNPYVKAWKKPRRPCDWIRFPWEEDETEGRAKAGEYRLGEDEINELERIRKAFYGENRGNMG